MKFRASLLTLAGLLLTVWVAQGHRFAAWSQDLPAAFPRVLPTEPADVGKKFHIQKGFRMDLIAAEPLTTDPVAMAYDENGLAWVVEMTDYPYTDKKYDVANSEQKSPPIGCVRILEDTDGDGKFDKSDVFARELSWPTGIALYDGGAFVAATPDIWYLKDTDGDRKADIRKKVFTGFRKVNVQGVMNNLQWGLDHRIYGAGASNGGTVTSPEKPEMAAVTVARNDYRFDPKSYEFAAISGGSHFGQSFDDWGNRFLCHIRNPAQHVVLPAHYLARNSYLPVPAAVHDIAEAGDQLPVFRTSAPEPWRAIRARRFAQQREKAHPRSETVGSGFVTSSSGITLYRGAAYPPEYRNNIFVAEVAGNLIHRKTLAADGVTFVARRADPDTEFVSSEDNWFRPVNFVNAPDGTLHVVDMYRETIEHPWSIPDDIKALLDLESGRDRGRIYRLAPPGFRPPAPPRLGKVATAQLVQSLENPNSWWRDTAHRLIFERQDPAAVVPLRNLVRKSASPLARLHALWSLDGLKALTDDDVLAGLSDGVAGVRENAVRLAEPRLRTSRPLLERVAALAADPELRVRFQVAFSLGEAQDPLATAGLLAIARRDAADPWVRVAVLSSLSETAGEVLLGMLKDRDFARDAANGLPFARQLALVVGARDRKEEMEKVVAALAAWPESPESRVVQTNALLGLGEGQRRARKSLKALASPPEAPAAKLIAAVLADAATMAQNPRLEVSARQNGVEMLGYGSFEEARKALVPLLDARQPRELQMASVRALADFNDPAIVPTLLAPWRSYTPAVRSEVIDQLLARPDRIMPVLEAIAAGTVPPSQVSSARRVMLWTHRDMEIRERARSLLAAEAPSPRKEVIEQYRPVLSLPSDRQRGRVVFQRECTGCHRLEEKGHDIGPSLTTIRHRTPDEVLTHILDPNREVAQNFVQYVVITDDGRTVTGVIADETATSVTLKRPEGATDQVLRRNIEEMSSTGMSLMPEGLEKKVQPQEMADLIAYLLGG